MLDNPTGPQLLAQGAGLLAGLLLLWPLGRWANGLSRRVAAHASRVPPDGVSRSMWRAATEIPRRSKKPLLWLGCLERLLFYFSFWLGAYELAAGWLIFKAASKWEIWQTIIKVPDRLDTKSDGGCKEDAVQYLGVRNRLGSTTLQRWLIGTLANALIALVATFLALGVQGILSDLISGQQSTVGPLRRSPL